MTVPPRAGLAQATARPGRPLMWRTCIKTLTENDRMTQMINGYWITQIVHAAAAFSLADHCRRARHQRGYRREGWR